MKTVNDLSPLTKVWIYQSDKELSAAQLNILSELSGVFLQNWESHGKPVNGTIQVFYNRFIVFFIDEQDEQACGRCVDASVRFTKELEQELNVTLLDRMQVAYRKNEKIVSCTLAEFEKLIEKGGIGEHTTVFNNTVHSLTEFKTKWEVPLKDSWHARYLPVKK